MFSCCKIAAFVFVGWQVLGRTGPLPLILLPQFGGYWIEGTNHDLGSSSTPEEPPPCPASQDKLETNSIAKIYRKNFLGKVRFWGDKVIFNYSLAMKSGLPKLNELCDIWLYTYDHTKLSSNRWKGQGS